MQKKDFLHTHNISSLLTTLKRVVFRLYIENCLLLQVHSTLAEAMFLVELSHSSYAINLKIVYYVGILQQYYPEHQFVINHNRNGY